MTTVVVTGASAGIGRALALAWARRGASLVLSARNAGPLEELGREVETLGGTALVEVGDVTDEAHRVRLVERAAKTGRLDVLVNNAGRGFYAPAMKVDVVELRNLFELNVVAPLRLAQLGEQALEASRGTIVMMSSIAGMISSPKYAAYSASKFALEAIAMSMRCELAAKGVQVVVVRPGPVFTQFRNNAIRSDGEAGYRDPDPKAQSPDDVAEITLRAVDRGTAVTETSAYVRGAVAVSRLAPPLMRLALARMARGK